MKRVMCNNKTHEVIEITKDDEVREGEDWVILEYDENTEILAFSTQGFHIIKKEEKTKQEKEAKIRREINRILREQAIANLKAKGEL
jgi:hypothetical protein